MDELDLRLSLVKNIFASLDKVLKDDDLQKSKSAVMDVINRWFRVHLGLEDNTVECTACHEPTTKMNRIVSDHWGEPKYLCGRCCDGITGAPISHGEKARVVIGQ